ncbi:MAG: hypothetical protein Q8P34_02870 [Bacteroidota bacterium]|nr:hypothetical protein [Bacteroidota bacterium]
MEHNLKLKRIYDIVNILRVIKVRVDNKEFILKANQKVDVELELGLHNINASSGSLRSKSLKVELKHGEAIEIIIKGRLSNSLIITSNLIMTLTLILSYSFSPLLRLFWICLAINSFIHLYFFAIKKNDFFAFKINTLKRHNASVA